MYAFQMLPSSPWLVTLRRHTEERLESGGCEGGDGKNGGGGEDGEMPAHGQKRWAAPAETAQEKADGDPCGILQSPSVKMDGAPGPLFTKVVDPHVRSNDAAIADTHPTDSAPAGSAAQVLPAAVHAAVQLCPSAPSCQAMSAPWPHWASALGANGLGGGSGARAGGYGGSTGGYGRGGGGGPGAMLQCGPPPSTDVDHCVCQQAERVFEFAGSVQLVRPGSWCIPLCTSYPEIRLPFPVACVRHTLVSATGSLKS